MVAAGNGYLKILQWARENGCPWDEDTCSFAALNGHLEVLQWARANGCPWNVKMHLRSTKWSSRSSSMGKSKWLSLGWTNSYLHSRKWFANSLNTERVDSLEPHFLFPYGWTTDDVTLTSKTCHVFFAGPPGTIMCHPFDWLSYVLFKESRDTGPVVHSATFKTTASRGNVRQIGCHPSAPNSRSWWRNFVIVEVFYALHTTTVTFVIMKHFWIGLYF